MWPMAVEMAIEMAISTAGMKKANVNQTQPMAIQRRKAVS
jgi:hypothetical protein